MTHTELLTQSTTLLQDSTQSIDARLTNICSLLKTQISHYDWVGFYFKNGNKPELKLRAFSGEPTDHIIIPFGKGICGQVAESNQSLNITDVSGEGNYIACGIDVKSELVVPLFKNGENIGQIDIDSHSKAAFSDQDDEFLTAINREVSKILD